MQKLVAHPHYQYNSAAFDRASVWRLWKHAREIQHHKSRQIACQILRDIAMRDTSFAPGKDYPVQLPETCRGVDTGALRHRLVQLASSHPRIDEAAAAHIHSHITFPRTTEDSVGKILVNIRRSCNQWAPDQPGQ